jgi:hypothetical protein
VIIAFVDIDIIADYQCSNFTNITDVLRARISLK